jgi:HlyD family secretion protein
MQSSKRKWWIGGTIVVALVAIGGFTLRSSKKVEYVTSPITRGDINSTISATGNCNAVVSVAVGSQVSGNILELHADYNTKVTKNQLVARIDPAPFQAKVDQVKASLESAHAAVINARATSKKAEADIANAEANVANQKANIVRAQSAVNDAKIKYERRKEMFPTGVLSKEDLGTAQATYDQAVASLEAAKAQLVAAQDNVESAKAQREVVQTQLATAESQVKQQQASLTQAQLDLDHTQIRAPVDGTVIARNMDVGQTVAASFSAPTIFQIAQDLTKMQVDANIDESDIGRVQQDQPVTFTVDAYPGQIFRGAVTQVRKSPINVQNVITYDVVIQVDNSDLKLFPGMTANVSILTDHVTDVLKLPNAALRFRPPDALAAAKGGQSGKGKFQGKGGFGGGGSRGGFGAGRGRGRGGSAGQVIYLLGEDGKPKPVRVRLGIGDGNFVQVLSGDLKEGDKVITNIASTAARALPTGGPGGGFGGPGGFRGRGPF